MDEPEPIWSHALKLGDQNCSDVIICLKNEGGKPECFHSHSFLLRRQSNYFANKLREREPELNPISQQLDIHCTFEDYQHYVELLKRLYYPLDSLLDSWDSVRLAVGVLQAAVSLDCEEIIKSCIQYLEAVPWEDKEEELILKVAAKLGSIAMPIMARIQPVDPNATKTVFISAIRFATSCPNEDGCGGFLPFLDGNDGLKTSAQEQIEYMLSDDDGMPLIKADNEVKTETRIGLSRIFSSFETDLSEPDKNETKILTTLSDLEWMCSVLPKMDMMKDFVFKWTDISSKITSTIQDSKQDSSALLWDLKHKLIEVANKVLEAVGYGNVIIPSQSRVNLVKTWLPFIRKTKPVMDSSNANKKMDEDLCRNIEGALVSLILALPSNDQAEIFMEWMKNTEEEEAMKYPDLSEAFEVWCYRTKSAKRRLLEEEEGIEPVGNNTTTVSL